MTPPEACCNTDIFIMGLDVLMAIGKYVIENAGAIATLAGVAIAFYGLEKWKKEFSGKRKIELAEEILALFYEARDAITAIRSPFGFQGEGSTRKPQEGETPQEKDARDRAYAVYERYEKRQEVFNRLHSKRYQFMARFGNEKAKPFEDLRMIVIEIQISASRLAEIWSRPAFNEEDKDSVRKERREHQSVIWSVGRDDPIEPRIKKVISDIEAICRPIIIGKKIR